GIRDGHVTGVQTCALPISPGKGGQKFESKVPIFDTVADAVAATGANTSVIYVPARFAADAMFEASDAGLALVVCITEGVPVLDKIGRASCRERVWVPGGGG